MYGHPDFDVYALVETRCTASSCVDIVVRGYKTFHCVRPREEAQPGGVSGGITVLVRESSVLCAAGINARCDASTGIVWLEIPRYQLCIACCYFSPARSSIYTNPYYASRPVAMLLNGLEQAKAAGMSCHIVCGDLNCRIGTLHGDVPQSHVLPPHASTLAAAMGHSVQGIPSRRHSQDLAVPDQAAAAELLDGLFAASCVVLNGRAPGDELGRCTCWKHNTSGGRIGSSVVDYGIVSTNLYPAVQRFEVMAFKPALSQDHCALLMQVRLQAPQRTSTVSLVSQSRRRVRVLRPACVESFGAALGRVSQQCSVLLQNMRQQIVSVSDGLEQLIKLLTAAAESSNQRRARRPPPAGGDKPWYDDECRALCAAFKTAWQAWQDSRSGGGIGDLAVRDAMKAARRAYRQACNWKRRTQQQQQQISLLELYFGQKQRDFWKVFLEKQHSPCPIDDVEAWASRFATLFGSPPQELHLTAADTALQQQLMSCRGLSAASFDCLNVPYSIAELANCLYCLPSGKAADMQGLTCELLAACASSKVVPVEDGSGESRVLYECKPVLDCILYIMQHATSSQEDGLPACMRVSKVGPVPKANQAAAPLDLERYRSICIGSIFTKVLERLCQQRLDTLVEENSCRAPTQCGFRRGHGTLDAIFALQHLVISTRFRKSVLYAVFVDFKRAFDMVRRDLLIQRCKALGMHGEFLETLACLYERVVLQVVVNGKTGTAFDTYLGTRQGSELSPLLFGLFIEMLHELISLQLPGAGPMVDALTVPDLLYADDVVLLANSPGAAQQLLDCLALFCRLFGMEVNLAPEKTCVMVFRRPHCRVPRGLHLTYQGQTVPLVEEYRYLGVLFSATRSLMPAANALAASASRAMHTVLRRLKHLHMTQLDIKCRMFDSLVESICSYGSHVWGPELFHSRLLSAPLDTAADRVHLSFLRAISGIGAGVCSKVLLRDLHRMPIMFHWVLLAVRWWNKLSDMAPADDAAVSCVAYHAWKADILLMQAGCKACWCYQLLQTLEALQVLSPAVWRTASLDGIMQLQISASDVTAALSRVYKSWWATGAATHPDPRTAPSAGVDMCTHLQWVYAHQPEIDIFDRFTAPRHVRLCLPFRVIQTLIKFRTGWHHLEVHGGRMARIPRHQRVCKLCSCANSKPSWWCRISERTGTNQNVEDLMHFLLECPAYDHIRARYAAIFEPPEGHDTCSAASLRKFFDATNQAHAATALYQMHSYRLVLLGLIPAHTIDPSWIQPNDYRP